jgi:hypothetical protein
MKSMMHYNLVEAIPVGGCCICTMLERDTDQYLESLLYEYTTDREIHHWIRDRKGLCNLHANRLLHFRGNAPGIALLYWHATDDVVKTLDQAESPASGGILGRVRGQDSRALHDKLSGESTCLCCQNVTRKQTQYMDIVGAGLSEAEFRAAYHAGDGVCLPHLKLLLGHLRKADHVQFIVEHQREKLRVLRQQLYSFNENMTASGSDVGDSWQRAIPMIAGKPGVFGDDR